MPKSRICPLHIAASLSQLEAYCRLDPNINNSSILEKNILAVLFAAEKAKFEDEEQAYILFSRACTLYNRFKHIKKGIVSEELKTGAQNAEKSITALRNNLTDRYEINNIYSLVNSLPVCDDPIVEKSNTRSTTYSDGTIYFPGRWMPPDALYTRLNNKSEVVFFIDVRSRDEYDLRKIKNPNQINLGGFLPTGLAITSLERRMSDAEKSLWKLHVGAKLIVLLDNKSGCNLIARPEDAEQFELPARHSLKIIYDALFTYNANKDLLPPTVFLAGGVDEFTKRYPSEVDSNPVAKNAPQVAMRPTDRIRYPSILDPGVTASIDLPTEDNYGEEDFGKEAESAVAPSSANASSPSTISSLSYAELSKQLKTVTPLIDAPAAPPLQDLRKLKPITTVGRNDSEEMNLTPPSITESPSNVTSIGTPPVKVDRSSKPIIPTSPQTYENDVSDTKTGHLVPHVDRSIKPHVIPERLGDDAITNHSNQSIGRVPVGVTLCHLRRGLVNLGNTCYMNSTLQSLLHTPDVWRFFMTFKRRGPGEIAGSFASLVVEMSEKQSAGNSVAVRPKNFKTLFGRHHSMFAGFQQQDGHEFLILLLDSLHEDLNKGKRTNPNAASADPLTRVPLPEDLSPEILGKISWDRNRQIDDSEILDWFNGQFRSTVRCKICGRSSYTFDEFMYLSVSVQSGHSLDLMSCIRQFFKPEELTGSSRWMCPKCKVPREAIKTFDIWRLPEYLIVHLKRFQCFTVCQKIESNVVYPLMDLNMSSFAKHLDPATECKYSLYAVVNHHGTMDSGHYTAFCKDAIDDKWFEFDDSRVSVLSNGEVQTKAAYMLFYRRSTTHR